MQTSRIPIRGFFKNKKVFETSFRATFFVECLDKNFSFVILHKLTKFHYQSLPSKVIQ